MPTLTIEYATEAERLDWERVIAYKAEMKRLGLTAAHGTALDACERFALDAGRKLIRDNLEAAVQARADAEKKVPAPSAKGGGPATW